MDKFKLRKEIGKNWFTNSMVDEWKKLERNLIEATTVEKFRGGLNTSMDGVGKR